jgi:hypothetical protein
MLACILETSFRMLPRKWRARCVRPCAGNSDTSCLRASIVNRDRPLMAIGTADCQSSFFTFPSSATDNTDNLATTLRDNALDNVSRNLRSRRMEPSAFGVASRAPISFMDYIRDAGGKGRMCRIRTLPATRVCIPVGCVARQSPPCALWAKSRNHSTERCLATCRAEWLLRLQTAHHLPRVRLSEVISNLCPCSQRTASLSLAETYSLDRRTPPRRSTIAFKRPRN